MSLAYIRSYYGVPAKRGMRVVADGNSGQIIGSQGSYLRIRLDGQSVAHPYHPTWRIDYPQDPAARQRGVYPDAPRVGRRSIETVELDGVTR